MARRAHQNADHDRALPAAVLLLLIASFLPARFLLPASWFGDLVGVVTAPVAQPLRLVGGWLAPPDAGEADPDEIAALRRQTEEFKTLYLRAQARNNDLLRQMEQLKLMVELNPSVSTRFLKAPVIGATSDAGGTQLLIRAGAKLGVHQNDVVAVAGVQLFGKVRNTSPMTSWIMPITAKHAERIEGKVMVTDERGPLCLLAPTGDGTLQGDVLYDDDDPAMSKAVAVGQQVRLLDKSQQWPESAQMLVIGTVESVEPAPDSPLRPVIVVRPLVDLDRVTEVIVRVNSMPTDEGEGTP